MKGYGIDLRRKCMHNTSYPIDSCVGPDYLEILLEDRWELGSGSVDLQFQAICYYLESIRSKANIRSVFPCLVLLRYGSLTLP